MMQLHPVEGLLHGPCHAVINQETYLFKGRQVSLIVDFLCCREVLEIDEKKLINISKMLDIVNLNKDDFIDDPEVPPLE